MLGNYLVWLVRIVGSGITLLIKSKLQPKFDFWNWIEIGFKTRFGFGIGIIIFEKIK